MKISDYATIFQSVPAPSPPLPSLQYIQQLIRKDYKDIEAILVPPSGQDETVWKYEHLRWDSIGLGNAGWGLCNTLKRLHNYAV